MAKIHELRQRKADLVAKCRTLNDTAETEERDLSAEEEKEFAEAQAAIGTLNAKIAREESLMDQERSLEGIDVEEPADRVAATPKAGTKAAEEKRFQSFGEQLIAIAHADGKHTHRSEWDSRLADLWSPGRGYQAASDASGANEAVPSDGGFAVQTDFVSGIMEMAHDQGDVMSRVRRIPISANSNGVKLLGVDETSRVDGSRWGGVQGYWANEAATVTATRPKYREIDLKLNKLMALGYSTEELLQDASALESVMMRAFAEEIVFKTEDAIVNGDGAGKPLGWVNSGALISVAPESGQAAATIRTENILNMWTRMPARSRRNAVWFINQDCETQLFTLTLGSGTAVVLLYMPGGTAMNNGSHGTLMGRPVIPIEYCATLGTAGDIMLVDPSQYLMIDKNGVQQASSMHVRFLYDEMTFRVTYRLDGQPAWRTALTPKNGATTQSPFVSLATRS